MSPTHTAPEGKVLELTRRLDRPAPRPLPDGWTWTPARDGSVFMWDASDLCVLAIHSPRMRLSDAKTTAAKPCGDPMSPEERDALAELLAWLRCAGPARPPAPDPRGAA